VNVEIFAEWLRRQGHSVVKTPSSYWHTTGRGVYQAFPYHAIIAPPEDELRDLLHRRTGWALRYSTAFDSGVMGCASYHAVYEKSTYDLNDLARQSRQNVLRSQRVCHVEPLPLEHFISEGWTLHCDTLHRQGRELRISQKEWQNRWRATADLPGFERWGSFVQGSLVASLVSFRLDGWCYLIYQQCRGDHLSSRAIHGLTFSVTRNMVERPGVSGIFYGMHSLDAPASVDVYKFRMGYVPKPIRQRILFHPYLCPLINPATHGLLEWAKAVRPGNPIICKTEGMVRFYLEGKLPIREQTLPENLREFTALSVH